MADSGAFRYPWFGGRGLKGCRCFLYAAGKMGLLQGKTHPDSYRRCGATQERDFSFPPCGSWETSDANPIAFHIPLRDHVLPPSDWKTRTAVGVPPHVRHRSEVPMAKRLGTRVEAFPYGNRCVLPQDEKRSEDPVPGRIAPCPSLR